MNEDVIKHLKDLFFLYNENGNRWRAIAFEKAAYTLSQTTTNLSKDFNFADIKGIGSSIAYTIIEFLTKGTSQRFIDLEKEVGVNLEILEDLRLLTKIPKIGIKTAKKIYKEYGISTIKDLEEAVASGKIKGTIANTIKEGIKFVNTQNEKLPWFIAINIAEVILYQLQKVGVAKIAGSLRRREDTIRDFDFVAVAQLKYVKKVLDGFKFKTKDKSRSKVYVKYLEGGDKKAIFEININGDARKADITLTMDESFGNNLNYLTGSKNFNIFIRQKAMKQGFKINEHFTIKKDTEEKMPSSKERDIYEILGIDFIPPECRITGAEIEDSRFSEKNLIPRSTKVIKGDLHIHSDASDGIFKITDLARMAIKEKYSFFGISDHSEKSHGPKYTEIPKHARKIRSVSKEFNIPIYVGSEIDVTTKGLLDYPVSVLKHFDYVILSTHRENNKNVIKRQITAIKQIRDSYPNMPIIIAHPTGRKIGTRPGSIDEDWNDFFEYCAKTNVLLEINCQPDRCDLPAKLIRLASSKGCIFILQTDNHYKNFRESLRPGIIEARRGGLNCKDIINTDYRRIKEWIKKPNAI